MICLPIPHKGVLQGWLLFYSESRTKECIRGKMVTVYAIFCLCSFRSLGGGGGGVFQLIGSGNLHASSWVYLNASCFSVFSGGFQKNIRHTRDWIKIFAYKVSALGRILRFPQIPFVIGAKIAALITGVFKSFCTF